MVISEEEISAHYEALKNVPSWKNRQSTLDFRYKHVVTEATYAPHVTDEKFLKIWGVASKNTLVDIYRSYELWALGKQAGFTEGAILEIGTSKGGTGLILAASVRGQKNKKVYLCDTFIDLPKGEELEINDASEPHLNVHIDHIRNLLASGWIDNVEILQGVFPIDIADQIPERIAILHINIDAYQHSKNIVEWAIPRLTAGSVIVFSKYGFDIAEGVTLFCNELRSDSRFKFVHNLNGHGNFIYLGGVGKPTYDPHPTSLKPFGRAIAKKTIFWIFLVAMALVTAIAMMLY